jgi:hypothetical protein
MAASEHEKQIAEEIRNKSDIDLASFRKDHPNPTSIYAIFADKEYEQRARVAQHELDRKLILEMR